MSFGRGQDCQNRPETRTSNEPLFEAGGGISNDVVSFGRIYTFGLWSRSYSLIARCQARLSFGAM